MIAFMQSTVSQRPAAMRSYAIRGLGADATAALRGMMGVLGGRTRCGWRQGELPHADVLILGPNADSGPERALIDTARMVVRVTLSDASHLGEVTRLEYPFRVFQVLSALDEVDAKLEASEGQAAHPVSRNPSWALFDALRQLANHSGRSRWYSAGGELCIREDLAEFAATPAACAELQAGRLPQQGIRPCHEPGSEMQRGDASELLWCVGVHSGRGGLSESLDAAASYRLLAWPNFGVVHPQRAHLRTCALLAAAPHSRDELVQLLGGSDDDLETVNRFLNACAICGLLHVEHREAAAPRLIRAPAAAASFMEGLVASIRVKLGFGLSGKTSAR